MTFLSLFLASSFLLIQQQRLVVDFSLNNNLTILLLSMVTDKCRLTVLLLRKEKIVDYEAVRV